MAVLLRRTLPRLSIILQSHHRTPIGVGIMSRYMTSYGTLSNDIHGPSTNGGPSDPPPPPPPNDNWFKKLALDIVRSPTTVTVIGGVILTTLFGCVKLWWESKAKERAIDNMMENGTKPRESVESPVERNDIVERIKNKFILGQGTEKAFGVILGPTGTGKTYVIREAHRQNPKGSLYFEIGGVRMFPWELAEATGVRIEPTFWSLVLGRIFPSSLGYYPLPSDYIKSLEVVIKSLAKRAAVFKEKHGRSPCLFIDGVDLLAKHNHEAFIELVEIAKSHANDGNLRIVFGCSEGHVMPLIRSTSSKTRVKVMEVLDLPEDKAVGYLTDKGLPKDFADRVKTEIGCRMIFLVRVVEFYHEYKSQFSTDDDLLKKIKDRCRFLFIDLGYYEIVMRSPRSTVIIKHLLKFDSATGFDPEVFLYGFSEEAERRSMEEALHLLVSSNALRYTEEGQVTWHSKMMEEKVKKELELK